MFIFPILFVQIFISNVISRLKRTLSDRKSARMSEDLDDLFLSPIPAPSAAELQQCILFGFRRRLCPTQIVDECRCAFGPFAPSAQYVAQWYQRFQDGFFNTNEDEHEEADADAPTRGCGQTPTTCSDYDDDEVPGILPLVLNDIGHCHSPNRPVDINADEDFYKDNNDDDDDDDDGDGHVIGYWQGYGYLGGKRSGISISALPPLPKSLIGFNKLLGSDSGLLLSDGEAVEPPPAAPERLNNNNNNSTSSSSETSQKYTNIDINLGSQHKRETNDNNDNKIDKSTPTAAPVAATAAATATLEIITPSNVCANGNTTVTTTSASPPASAAKTKATTTVSPAKESPHLNASTLDDQIATLRKEMNGLRQLDLSLLSQLWVLNESIQEFRAMIEEQENEDEDEEEGMGLGSNDLDVQRHSPTPSSYESVSSEGGGDVASDVVSSATKAKCLGTIPKVITTQPKIIRELISQQHQEQQPDAKQKPVPRMRSAPPPPPHSALALATSTSTSSIAATTERKPTAPSRPT
ncbi:phosphatidylinositol 3-kinase 2 isoform X5 [Drosophila pseudoobscura]|uniref:Phosphatidylinositol 3-kinase 2 isoform X5 n=2 Tax=Drosophila pseudoobscura pseudoobscura TaxID=46245 RepID=A0A6I8ULY6_DROPS|nr:phosphatidylinositol 3-kinase 2 isoform X5 [Drosophila pseudoobscura]